MLDLKTVLPKNPKQSTNSVTLELCCDLSQVGVEELRKLRKLRSCLLSLDIKDPVVLYILGEHLPSCPDQNITFSPEQRSIRALIRVSSPSWRCLHFDDAACAFV